MRRLSLPQEHGAYLTLAGAAAAGLWIAPARLPALGFALAVAAAFFARAPVERRHRASWDRPALAVYALVATVGIALQSNPWVAVAAALAALGLVFASHLARDSRMQRNPRFELVGLAALGASAGAIALAGGASLRQSALVAVILGAHAASSVLLVRSELRRGERTLAHRAEFVALSWILAGALAAALIGSAPTMVALLPRLVHLGSRWIFPSTEAPRAARVGVRETVLLALTVLLVVLTRS